MTCFTSGCTSELTCRDLGCAPGETCNRTTGECEPESSDCTDTGCPEGDVCDPERGICRPETTPCPERNCPSGQICNSQTGFCQPAPNCQRDQCPSPAETCNAETGECIPRSCDRDGACPSGYLCGTSGTCRRGCRLEQANCPAGRVCQPVPEDETGRCLSECTSNQDCPHGQRCVGRGAQSACEIEPPCQRDEDCRTDEVCRAERCSAPPCRSDDDCEGARVCDRATGRCVGGSCTEDLFAPNHERSAAARIDVGGFSSLELCPGRHDWFALDVESSERLVFRLEHDARRDLDIALFDELGQRLAANQQSPGRRGTEGRGRFASRLSWRADRPRTLFIRIESHPPVLRGESDRGSGVAVGYELQIERSDRGRCDDDSFEENDRRSEATSVSTRLDVQHLVSDKRICSQDADWYVLSSLAAGRSLSMQFDASEEHLAAMLFSPSGRRWPVEPGESLRIARTDLEGDWLLRVASTRGRTAGYTFRYEIGSSYDCPGAGSRSSLEEAHDLSPGVQEQTHLCPSASGWEVDWYELAPPPLASTLRLELDAAPSLPGLNVTLFERTSQGLARLRRAHQLEDSTYLIERLVDPSRSLVLRVGSSDSLGWVRGEPTYEWSYRYESN